VEEPHPALVEALERTWVRVADDSDHCAVALAEAANARDVPRRGGAQLALGRVLDVRGLHQLVLEDGLDGTRADSNHRENDTW
jgi:hypothetical protein